MFLNPYKLFLLDTVLTLHQVKMNLITSKQSNVDAENSKSTWFKKFPE